MQPAILKVQCLCLKCTIIRQFESMAVVCLLYLFENPKMFVKLGETVYAGLLIIIPGLNNCTVHWSPGDHRNRVSLAFISVARIWLLAVTSVLVKANSLQSHHLFFLLLAFRSGDPSTLLDLSSYRWRGISAGDVFVHRKEASKGPR